MVDQHKHRQRGYTEAQWLGIQGDPVLSLREVGWILDTGEYVVGDGSTAFSGLQKMATPVAVSASAPSSPETNEIWIDTSV